MPQEIPLVTPHPNYWAQLQSVLVELLAAPDPLHILGRTVTFRSTDQMHALFSAAGIYRWMEQDTDGLHRFCGKLRTLRIIEGDPYSVLKLHVHYPVVVNYDPTTYEAEIVLYYESDPSAHMALLAHYFAE